MTSCLELKAENGKLIRDLTELIPNPQCRLTEPASCIGGRFAI